MHYIAEKHLLGRRMENSYYTHWLDNYIVKCNKICEESSQILWHSGASLPSVAIGFWPSDWHGRSQLDHLQCGECGWGEGVSMKAGFPLCLLI